MLSQSSPPDPDALFSAIQFAEREHVVVAVSGGGDSLALLLLLYDYLRQQDRASALLAVTVDHGLRPDALLEAREVERVCAAHGIAHRTYRWEGPKPATGVSAAAREARLRLLAQSAAEAGTDLVLTGHTADDQAETLAMRSARGSGRGDAGIAPASLFDGRIWLVRPLLDTRREALRAYLRMRGVLWVEDPSNTDQRFERARVRTKLHEHDILRLHRYAREARAAREDAGRQAAALIADVAEIAAPGLLRLDLAAMEGVEKNITTYILRILLAVAGGTLHLPDETRAAAVLAEALKGGFRATLSRAVVASRQGRLYLHRERRDLPETPANEGAIWDGRYRVVAKDSREGLTVGPFGEENARDASVAGLDAPAGLARSALAAQPALWLDGRCLGLASAARERVLAPVAGPWARLLPSFDLAAARAVMELLRGEPVPPTPWLGPRAALK